MSRSEAFLLSLAVPGRGYIYYKLLVRRFCAGVTLFYSPSNVVTSCICHELCAVGVWDVAKSKHRGHTRDLPHNHGPPARSHGVIKHCYIISVPNDLPLLLATDNIPPPRERGAL